MRRVRVPCRNPARTTPAVCPCKRPEQCADRGKLRGLQRRRLSDADIKSADYSAARELRHLIQKYQRQSPRGRPSDCKPSSHPAIISRGSLCMAQTERASRLRCPLAAFPVSKILLRSKCTSRSMLVDLDQSPRPCPSARGHGEAKRDGAGFLVASSSPKQWEVWAGWCVAGVVTVARKAITYGRSDQGKQFGVRTRSVK